MFYFLYVIDASKMYVNCCWLFRIPGSFKNSPRLGVASWNWVELTLATSIIWANFITTSRRSPEAWNTWVFIGESSQKGPKISGEWIIMIILPRITLQYFKNYFNPLFKNGDNSIFQSLLQSVVGKRWDMF